MVDAELTDRNPVEDRRSALRPLAAGNAAQYNTKAAAASGRRDHQRSPFDSLGERLLGGSLLTLHVLELGLLVAWVDLTHPRKILHALPILAEAEVGGATAVVTLHARSDSCSSSRYIQTHGERERPCYTLDRA